jgi:Mor family transcriptional regulator
MSGATSLVHDDCFRNKSPELLADLASQCSAVIHERLGLDAVKADEIGRETAERMSFIWGGQNVYFPKGLIYQLSIRDRQIFDEFNGKNHADLARKYKVSLQWIYKLIKTVRAEEIAKRQMTIDIGF